MANKLRQNSSIPQHMIDKCRLKIESNLATAHASHVMQLQRTQMSLQCHEMAVARRHGR
jgi:hypothetical protein